jgi:RNA polymerase sigma-54 factor
MLKPSLQLKLGQQLTMTPQLQQAIRLLQLPALELQAHIRELLESNVMLEAVEELDGTGTFEILSPVAEPVRESERDTSGSDDSGTEDAPREPGIEVEVEVVEDPWSDRTAGPSDTPYGGSDDREQEYADESGRTLHEDLLAQVELAGLSERDLGIASAIIDAINDDGYVTEPLSEIANTLRPEIDCDEETVERVLMLVQMLDPPGVGARTVSECIGLQLSQFDPGLPGLAAAKRIAEQHLELVAGREIAQLRRALGTDDETVEQALALVRSCHPRPGSVVSGSAAEYVVPDVFVRRTERGWSVEINPATVPRVRLNEGYASLIGRNANHATMRTQLQEARWLLKSLEIRNDTLLKVARAIVERQSEFLEQGDEFMRPMILRNIAEAIEMHESTISRITSGKYMHTPRGVFELRYFFSSHVDGDDGHGTSSTAIRAKIRKLIKDEDPSAPLSDSRLAEILSGEGIPVARRTVAKYREAMHIAASSERKRLNSR